MMPRWRWLLLQLSRNLHYRTAGNICSFRQIDVVIGSPGRRCEPVGCQIRDSPFSWLTRGWELAAWAAAAGNQP